MKKLLQKKVSRILAVLTLYALIGTDASANVLATMSSAQDIRIKGTVTDNNGDPLIGVSVKVENSQAGTITNVNGDFEFSAPETGILIFSYIGFMSKKIPINGRTTINVSLVPDTESLKEVVVVGYGTQKKTTLTGAISTIDNKQLVQSPVANISNSLAGRLSGIVAVQQSGEPGQDQSRIKIRGIATLSQGFESDPLVIVDGVERNMNLLDPNEIETVSALKDASATAVFGVRGANGVIIITTKTGKIGKPQISYSSNFGMQNPTQLPKLLNSYDYATLRNEAQKNMGQAPYFSSQDLETFKNGTDPIFHPNVNWFDAVLKPSSFQQQHNFNIGGGDNNTKYFISLGYFDQNGSYDVGELQKEYSANPRYKRYNIRSNFDVNFTKDFSASIKLGGQIADVNYPGVPAGEIFFRVLNTNPMMNPGVVDGKLISSVDGLPSSSGNPLGFLATSGYQNNFNSTINTNIGLQHKLDFITSGLKVRGALAYDSYYQHRVSRQKSSLQYRIVKDPSDPSRPVYLQDGEEAPFGFSEGYNRWRKIYSELATEYARSFGGHNVTGLVLYNLEKIHNPDTYNGVGYEFAEIPRAYMGLVGRVTYNFKSRYLTEMNMGYNGSENFPENKRFGFFPSFSLGWVLTEEPFIPKNNILSLLKIRGTYGEVGNDRLGSQRFMYRPDTYVYGGGYYFGEVGTNYQFYNGAREGRLGNPDITWERAKKSNIGFDAKFFNEKLSVTGDFFREKRDNILWNLQTVPDLVQATLPAANIGKVDNEGFEFDAGFNNSVRKLNYWVKANYSFSKNKIVYQDEPPRAYPWLQRTGQPVGQYFGLVNEGFYNTAEELAAAPKSAWTNQLQLGDIKYKDLNLDGVINDNDMTAIGHSTFPQITYGISTGFDFKGFDFSVLFQGASKVSTYLSEMAAWAFDTDWRSAQSRIHDRWTPERYAAGETISYPRLELSPTQGKHNYRPSDFWLVDGSYIRLKNMEVAYRFQGNALRRVGVKSLRVFTNGNNLITWSKIKNYDPEAPAGRGQFYPQMKVYNFGASLQF
ncbi:SusC/RagA family TonB-linked outer membrane protein [Paradesertivirga mongoliensis]|uniref:SusC/RagA family TonB-linked outer membrane protein n=1 Tax=Paradesertivirga mongoliensis TaxID=2100740 RepID=A0ABW4ZPH8_9SPHI|nr:TonB-dependent receptor [Pedobacter mongoliensis]